MLAGVRDFPAQMGAGSATSGLHRRGEVRREMAAEDVERPTQDALLPGGDRHGNAKTVGDHDIWRLPQADDTYRERTALPVHPQPAGVPSRRRPAR